MIYSNETHKLFIEALRLNGFNASAACRAVGIDRKTYTNWCDKYPDFAEDVKSVWMEEVDLTESVARDLRLGIAHRDKDGKVTSWRERPDFRAIESFLNKKPPIKDADAAPKSIISAGEVTKVFIETYHRIGKWKVIVNRGGARSSKTTSTVQILLDWLITGKIGGIEDVTVISIVRNTLPSLKKSVLRDIERIINEKNLPVNHKITEQYFEYKGRKLEYFSSDNHDKVKGTKRGILYMNEANEIPWPIVKQLMLRTQHTTLIDFNPDDENTWIKTEIEDKREDSITIKSTYLDNIFLDNGTRESLEAFKNDPEYWKVFGLGEYATFSGLVYPAETWATFYTLPNGHYHRQFAVDFGYHPDPTAILIQDFDTHTFQVYETEICYENNLSTSDIAAIIKQAGYAGELVVCDSAEKREVAELGALGLNAYGPAKEEIKKGIRESKRLKRWVHIESSNLQKELKYYKQTKDPITGNYTGTPIDKFNHLLDASRYGIMYYLKNYSYLYQNNEDKDKRPNP